MFKLQTIINNPTAMNIFFTGNLPAILAAKGAASIPPITNPKISCQ